MFGERGGVWVGAEDEEDNDDEEMGTSLPGEIKQENMT